MLCCSAKLTLLIGCQSHDLRVRLLLHQGRKNIDVENNHAPKSIGVIVWPRNSGRGSSKPTPAKRAAIREPSLWRIEEASLTAVGSWQSKIKQLAIGSEELKKVLSAERKRRT
jgi:hypothetical protein